MRDFPQKVKVEDVETKLLCETSFKEYKSGRCENEAFVGDPSKSKSGRYENEAVVGDFPQKMKVEDVRTKLSWETSLKK